MVGESGCGKSTIGKAILRAFDITGGKVVYNLNGEELDVSSSSNTGIAYPGISQANPNDLSRPKQLPRSPDDRPGIDQRADVFPTRYQER